MRLSRTTSKATPQWGSPPISPHTTLDYTTLFCATGVDQFGVYGAPIVEMATH